MKRPLAISIVGPMTRFTSFAHADETHINDINTMFMSACLRFFTRFQKIFCNLHWELFVDSFLLTICAYMQHCYVSHAPRFTAQKLKFFIKDFLSKCDQIRRKLRIWSHLQKKSLMENFIFCAVI